ncbi:hypothetical protein GE107_12785 [Cohnella sp. CFH 77786]|nr:hypothetical protein [Cohnella sp. CFH 77786]
MTYHDYAALDDDNRYELVDGVLELLTAPAVPHQVLSFQLQRRIADTCENEYLILHSPIDVILSPTDVRQPDLVLIPEYWIVDPGNGTLEQYERFEGMYELTDIYEGEERVRSNRIPYVSFTMEEIMASLRDLPI